MGDVVSDPKDDPNASKTAIGEEKTLEVGNKKVDFVPPLAPLKRTSKLSADGDNAIAGELTEKEFVDKMAKYEELLTPLPPDASLEDMERRRVLLAEQATKITERELDLTNKETEFVRKQREKTADDVFHPPRDKNLHKKLDFRSKWEDEHTNSVWRKYHHVRDLVTKLCYFNTPAKNMEAAQEVMFDKTLDRDARLVELGAGLSKKET